jgi:hypothetical protein
MTEKQMRSLGKTDLLTIMRKQEEEIERLGAENKTLSERLAQRALIMEDAGSIAEASLRIGGVMQAAQESANIYLESLRVMEAEYKGLLAKQEGESGRRAAEIIEEADRRAAEILREADRRAAARETLEKQTVDALWEDFKNRADQFLKAHAELGDMIRGNPAFAPVFTQKQAAEGDKAGEAAD